MLSDLLDKLTSYNLFNNLLPGAVFAFLADRYFEAGLVPDDLITAAFVYYFIGIVISRMGSLVVEPILKKLNLIRFQPYSDYVSATEKDTKIEILMESANMYRTFVALFVLLVVLGGYTALEEALPQLAAHRGYVGCFVLLMVFAVSYIKQVNYVSARVRKCAEKG